MMETTKEAISRYKPYLILTSLAAVAGLVGGWEDALAILGLSIGIWISLNWMKEGDD